MDRSDFSLTSDPLTMPRNIMIHRLARISDALLDAAIGLEDMTEYVVAGDHTLHVWQVLAAQVRICESAANTLYQDVINGQVRVTDERRGSRGK